MPHSRVSELRPVYTAAILEAPYRAINDAGVAAVTTSFYRDIVVIGGSSGSYTALQEILPRLPVDIPASIFIVKHLTSRTPSRFAEIFSTQASIDVCTPADGERIRQSCVYVAPPDFHMLIEEGAVRLVHGPRENRTRPAVDPLFRSAAVAYGQRTIGVVLSGYLDDGTAGLATIKAANGLTIVQDPDTAVSPDMPRSAIDYLDVDYCVSPSALAPLLVELTTQPNDDPTDEVADQELIRHAARELEFLRAPTARIDETDDLGQKAAAACPECGGPLWEMKNGYPRFRCHTGHAFTSNHLTAGLAQAQEESLWAALRAMEERARMLRRLAKRSTPDEPKKSYDGFTDRADELDVHIRNIRSILHSLGEVQAVDA